MFQFDLEAAKTNMAGGKGFHTGVTKARIVGIFPKKKGANDVVDIILENDHGGKAVVFGMMTAKQTATGKDNPHYARFMELAYHAGIRQGTIGKVSRKIGGVDTPSDAFVEATGKIVEVAMQTVFNVNNRTNEETQTWQVSKTFDHLGRTIESVEKDEHLNSAENFAVEDYYTKEWTAAKADGSLIIPQANAGTPATASTPATTEAAPTGKLF